MIEALVAKFTSTLTPKVRPVVLLASSLLAALTGTSLWYHSSPLAMLSKASDWLGLSWSHRLDGALDG